MSLIRRVKYAAIAAVVAGGGWVVVRAVGGDADQRRAESVSDDRELFQAARRPDVGLDERGRHRPRRPIDLGGRALRHQHLRREPATGKMSTLDPILLFDESGKLVQQLRRRPDGVSRTAFTSIATATCG